MSYKKPYVLDDKNEVYQWDVWSGPKTYRKVNEKLKYFNIEVSKDELLAILRFRKWKLPAPKPKIVKLKEPKPTGDALLRVLNDEPELVIEKPSEHRLIDLD